LIRSRPSRIASAARGAISAAALVACAAGESERDERAAQAVIGGQPDTADTAVVSIVTTPDAALPELCTGVLVAPRVVVTAGHCTLGQDATTLTVGFGPSAASPTSTAPIDSVLTYPSFTGTDADKAAGLDLGVILLAKDAGVAPVAIAQSGAGLVGAAVTVVGYGLSNAGDMQTRGTRRSAATSVVAECSGVIGFGDANVGACHGDSGGALFAQGKLVGIVWGGRTFACDPPSYATRLDRLRAWIDAVAAGSAAPCAASCPGAAADCTADAGADAHADSPVDASAESPVDASAPAETFVATGGCAVTRGDARTSRDAWPWLVVLACVLGRASPRRRGSRRR